MNREQAINYLFSSGFTNEQVGDVVRALTYEPTTKNDLGVDCISRADAIRVASGYCHPSNVAKELAKLPSVTPQEPKTGHWIKTGYYYTGAYGDIEYVECSCCHEDSLEEGDFCPNCGAKMESE